MSSRALEAKHEKILKELVRRPENKRCADCDTTVRVKMAVLVLCSHPRRLLWSQTRATGSIVCRDQLQHLCVHRLRRRSVRDFDVFLVSPTCYTGAPHSRQFGHRVKGITMASFKPEEIAALQAGGNQVLATCRK